MTLWLGRLRPIEPREEESLQRFRGMKAEKELARAHQLARRRVGFSSLDRVRRLSYRRGDILAEFFIELPESPRACAAFLLRVRLAFLKARLLFDPVANRRTFENRVP